MTGRIESLLFSPYPKYPNHVPLHVLLHFGEFAVNLVLLVA